jgi:hypothetical protein
MDGGEEIKERKRKEEQERKETARKEGRKAGRQRRPKARGVCHYRW